MHKADKSTVSVTDPNAFADIKVRSYACPMSQCGHDGGQSLSQGRQRDAQPRSTSHALHYHHILLINLREMMATQFVAGPKLRISCFHLHTSL